MASLHALGGSEAYDFRSPASEEGFCVIEVLFDDDGGVADYRFIQTTPAFEAQTGLHGVVGRTMRELAPDHEQHWFDTYGRIALTGEPERFESKADALDRWYDVYAFRIGAAEQHQVAVLFRDILPHKRAEEALLESHRLLRTTFDSSLQILQLLQAIRDDHGEIVDFEWLLTNKRWNDRWGPKAGKRLLAENPAVVGSGVWDKFLTVIETGEPITHEHYYPHDQSGGWFLQTIAKADDGILLSTMDIPERKRAETASRAKEDRYRTLFERTQQGFVVHEIVRDAEGRAIDLRYLELNPAFERLTGITAANALGKTSTELFGTVDPNWLAVADRVVQTGVPEQTEQYVAEIDRWFEAHYHADDDGRLAGTFEDVTVRKRAEEALRVSEGRLQVLVAELQHRVRNILTVIRSVFSRTANTNDDRGELVRHFDGRLGALARTHVVVTRTVQGTANLEDLIRDELMSAAVKEGERLVLRGPEVELDARTAETMSLAIHELTTNALKYGALAHRTGKVLISWQTDTDHGEKTRLIFTWSEEGVPTLAVAPTRIGFGRELIEEVLPYQLRAETSLEFCGGGIRCSISLMLPRRGD